MTPPRHHPVRRALHWLIALLVIGMIPAGLVFTDFDNRPWIEATFGEGSFNRFYDLHKSVGLTVLALMALRMLARLRWPDPPYAVAPPAWEARLARAAHLSLYVLLIVVPLLGWAGVSAFPAPLPVFGLFEAPALVGPDRALSRRLLDLHGFLALGAAAVIAAHVAAALRHRFIRRDEVFGRMAP